MWDQLPSQPSQPRSTVPWGGELVRGYRTPHYTARAPCTLAGHMLSPSQRSQTRQPSVNAAAAAASRQLVAVCLAHRSCWKQTLQEDQLCMNGRQHAGLTGTLHCTALGDGTLPVPTWNLGARPPLSTHWAHPGRIRQHWPLRSPLSFTVPYQLFSMKTVD